MHPPTLQCQSLEGRLKELRALVERNGGKVADFDKYAALKDLEYRVATGRAAADKLKAQVSLLGCNLGCADAIGASPASNDDRLGPFRFEAASGKTDFLMQNQTSKDLGRLHSVLFSCVRPS